MKNNRNDNNNNDDGLPTKRRADVDDTTEIMQPPTRSSSSSFAVPKDDGPSYRLTPPLHHHAKHPNNSSSPAADESMKDFVRRKVHGRSNTDPLSAEKAKGGKSKAAVRGSTGDEDSSLIASLADDGGAIKNESGSHVAARYPGAVAVSGGNQHLEVDQDRQRTDANAINSSSNSNGENGNGNTAMSQEQVFQATMVAEDDLLARERDVEALEEELKQYRNQQRVEATEVISSGQGSAAPPSGNTQTADTPSNNSNRNNKGRRNLLIMVCIALLIVVGIVVGVVVAFGGGSDGGGSGGDSGNNAGNGNGNGNTDNDNVTQPPSENGNGSGDNIPTTSPVSTPIATSAPSMSPTIGSGSVFPPSTPTDLSNGGGSWNGYSATSFALEGTIASRTQEQQASDCLNLCQQGNFVGMEYEFTSDFQSAEPNCLCYSRVICLLSYDDFITSFNSNQYASSIATQDLEPACNRKFCEVNPYDPLCFENLQWAQTVYSIHGTNLNLLASTSIPYSSSPASCLSFCIEYGATVIQHTYSINDGINCFCYEKADCFLPWDGDLPQSKRPQGNIYTNDPGLSSTICNFAFCDVNPNDPLCFTKNSFSYRDNGDIRGTVGISSNDGTEKACLEFCKEYDGVRLLTFVTSIQEGTALCTCFSTVECIEPWGDSVSTFDLSFGSIFYKDGGTQVCASDHCTFNPNSPLCFTGNSLSYRDDSDIRGTVGISSNDGTEKACLEFCKEYDGVRFLTFVTSIQADEALCTCFSTVECIEPWGDSVSTSDLSFGSIFFKDGGTQTCALDHCAFNSNSALCFTGSRFSYRSNGGIRGTVGISSNDGTEKACLEFCKDYEGVRFLTFITSIQDDEAPCTCYSTVDCIERWGDDVSTSDLSLGDVFVKDGGTQTCALDHCTFNPSSFLCT